MASRKLGQRAVNWIALGSRVPKEARAEFNSFRNRHEAIRASLLGTKEVPPSIDWDHYRGAIKKPGFVEKLESGVSSLKIPYPEDTQSEKIEADKVALESEIVAAIEESKANVSALTKELNVLLAEKPFEDVTTEEYLESHPELKEIVEERVRTGQL